MLRHYHHRAFSEGVPLATTPPTITVQGRALIPPQTTLARSLVMGNDTSKDSKPAQNRAQQQQKPISNLSVLLNQQEQIEKTPEHHTADEADSACGPPPTLCLGTSAPTIGYQNASRRLTSSELVRPEAAVRKMPAASPENLVSRR